MAAMACAPPTLNIRSTRRGAQHPLRTAGYRGGHGQHDGGGGQRGGAGRHVQADRADRHVNAFADDPGRGLDAERRRQLRCVELVHSPDRGVDRRMLGRIERAPGVREFKRRHRERFHLRAVEPQRQFTERRIAVPAYGFDDGAHVARGARCIALRGTLQHLAAFLRRQ
jgi:hypothetical protein